MEVSLQPPKLQNSFQVESLEKVQRNMADIKACKHEITQADYTLLRSNGEKERKEDYPISAKI